MQDKYAGDVGDFGKFAFLKHLAGLAPRCRLGINWYRTTRPERSSNDGRHVSYLDASHPRAARFRNCDAELYQRLGGIVQENRSVAALERSAILPQGTLFYSAPLPHDSVGAEKKIADRTAWFEESCSALRGSGVLFLDPDNGIQPAAAHRTEPRAAKYAFLDEMRAYYKQCDMLIVYHHRDRSPAPTYAAKFLEARESVDPSARIRVLRFKRISVRDYVFLYRPEMEPVVTKHFSAMMSPPFDFLFGELVIP